MIIFIWKVNDDHHKYTHGRSMTIITIIFRCSNLNSYRHSGHLSLPLYSHGVILRFSSSSSSSSYSALTSILPLRAD